MSSRLFPFSRRTTIRGIVAALLLPALVLVAACSSDDDSGNGATGDPLPTWTAAPSTGAPPAPTATAVSATPGTCEGTQIASLPRDNQRTYTAYPDMVIDPAKKYTAVVQTNKGNVTIALAADKAPRTVNSFVYLSCRGYFDGLTWHRYVANFVIQGGDPRGDGTGGPGYTFGLEISDLRHDTPGSVAMARSNDPNSNGSQWYITLATTPSTTNLDGSYTVFGKVTSGLEIAQSLRQGDRILAVSITEQ